MNIDLPAEIVRLFLAILLGGAIGMEREIRDKAAGFRTLILISAGSCIFTIFSRQLMGTGDPNRIAANIVTGIGFLGAGVIMRDGGQIKGLTTASTIWIVAAIGMGVGSGNLLFSTLATAIFLIVLWLFPYLERVMSIYLDVHTYHIKVDSLEASDIEFFKNVWKEFGLHVIYLKTMKENKSLVICCSATGNPKNQQKIIQMLLENEKVSELSY